MARGGGHVGGGFHGGGFRGGGFHGGFRGGYHRRYHGFHSYGNYYSDINPSFDYRTHYDGTPYSYSHSDTYIQMERAKYKLLLAVICFALCMMSTGYIYRSMKANYKKAFLTDSHLSGTITTEYLYDSAGLFDVESLTSGMEYFYEKTGVQPVLYVTDDMLYQYGQSGIDRMDRLYDMLFRDENHFLVVASYEYNYDYFNLTWSYYYGANVDSILDTDDIQFLFKQFSDVSGDSIKISTAVSDAFVKTADKSDTSLFGRIIWCGAFCVIILVILAAVGVIIKKKKDDRIIRNVKPEILNDDIPMLDEQNVSYINKNVDEIIVAEPEPVVREYSDTISWEDAVRDINEMKKDNQ